MDIRSSSQELRSVSVQADSTPIQFFAAVAAYFLAHLLIRVFVPGSLERDEAEIVYLTQQLRLGYGSQPPLYAWLQWVLFSTFGLNRFSLAILKDLLLIATYLAMFRLARPLIGLHGAVAAAVSLVLFPQIGWESLRDLTHSVLLTALACAALWCYFALLRKPSAERYALFGVIVGLGLQSKYNFGIFLAGLICASLFVPEHRQVLWNRKAGVAAAVAILVLLPHGIWLLDNFQSASTGTLHKMAEGTEEGGYLRNVAEGLSSMLLAAVAFSILFLAVYAAICWRYRQEVSFNWQTPESRFFLFLYGSFLILLIGIVLTGEVGKVKDRWMMPLLFSLPLAFFVMLPALRRRVVFERILRVCAVAGLAFLVLMPLRTYLGPVVGKISSPHYPYPQLAEDLEYRFPQVKTIVTGDTLIAGNLRFERQELRALLLSEVLQTGERLQGEVLLVMDDGDERDWLGRFRSAYPYAKIREQGQIRLDYRFGAQGHKVFDYAHVVLGGG